MSNLKIGDVVYLNSEDGVKMTVTEISENGVECSYYHSETGKVQHTPPLPEGSFTKI